MTTAPPATQQWPQIVEFKELLIRIWHNTISCEVGERNVPCWTYVSYGMSATNQPDLVVTLRRRPSELPEEYSVEPLSWFEMVYLWGRRGRKIDPYHTQERHFEHWLGSKKLETLTYGMPVRLPGFGPGVLPRNRLHGIALTCVESELAKLWGYTRVIGHLGSSVRWFPYPPWIDRDRDDSITWEQTDKTFPKQLFPVTKKIPNTSATRGGSRFILEFRPGSEDAVRVTISDSFEEAVVFDSHLHPNVTACYTWQTGNKDMALYRVSIEIIGLCFLLPCSQQSSDHYNIIEDGATIFLRDATWQTIHQALKNGRDIIIPLEGQDGSQPGTLELEFLRTTYEYPAVGLEIELADGFLKRWRSQNPNWLRNTAIRLDHIAINPGAHPDPTTKPSVVRLMEQVGQAVAAVVSEKPQGAARKCIFIAFGLPANTAEECFRLSASPDLDGINGKAIWDEFRRLHIPDKSEHNESSHVTMFFGVWE